jgi:7-carboxy-7-deazaguanine synthase
MLGTNPIRPPINDDGQQLFVQSVFATLQGEGPFAGQLALFIRLGGCNLACNFCDTEFESFTPMRLDGLLAEVKKTAGKAKLAVITGGEPLRQNIAPLCEALIQNGFTVQIETNGTLWRELPQEVHIVCSPKNTSGTYHPIRPDLMARIDAFKFIISEGRKEYAYVPDVGRGEVPVYVQPMDEKDAGKNQANMALATKLAMENNYRLSLQLQKIVGIL